jgi:hypothetical protein
MRKYLKPVSFLLLPVLLAWTGVSALAEGDQMSFTTYYFSDSGDNSVFTSSFNLAKKLMQQTALLIDIELDNVTVPAITAVTGATRPQRRKSEPFKKNRGQVIIGVEQGIGQNTTVAGNFYRSQEVDYVSNSVVGTISEEMNQKNTTLTFRAQYNADLVGKIAETGELTNRRKKVYTGAVNVSQILSPTTVLDVAYDFVYLKGFLSDPYRQVRVYDALGASTIVDELHPSTRARHAGTARISQLISSIRGSVIGSYRYYIDTWKVHSHTVEFKFNKYVFNDFVFSLDYRYYTQSGASFYKDRYVGPEYQTTGLRTADYKLKPFSSNNFGLSLSYLLRGLAKNNPDFEFLQNSAVEFMYFRYFNNLDFSADIIQANIKFSI